jgi:hypothetical protein
LAHDNPLTKNSERGRDQTRDLKRDYWVSDQQTLTFLPPLPSRFIPPLLLPTTVTTSARRARSATIKYEARTARYITICQELRVLATRHEHQSLVSTGSRHL